MNQVPFFMLWVHIFNLHLLVYLFVCTYLCNSILFAIINLIIKFYISIYLTNLWWKFTQERFHEHHIPLSVGSIELDIFAYMNIFGHQWHVSTLYLLYFAVMLASATSGSPYVRAESSSIESMALRRLKLSSSDDRSRFSNPTMPCSDWSPTSFSCVITEKYILNFVHVHTRLRHKLI